MTDEVIPMSEDGLERLIAALHSFADDIEDEAAVRGEVTPDEIALLRKSAAVLKAAEEMREAIATEVQNAKAGCEYSHQHRGCGAYTDRKMRCPDCSLDLADDLEKALTAYDIASRPTSATGSAVSADLGRPTEPVQSKHVADT